MAIDFPASPTNGQTHTVGSTTWTWDGTKWGITSGAAGATDKIEEGNTSAEVIDTGSDGRFVVTTEGTERLRVDSSGRLGIGITPAYALDVKSGNARFAFTNNNLFPRVFLGDANGNAENGYIHAYATIFETGGSTPGTGTERMRITSTGSVTFNNRSNPLDNSSAGVTIHGSAHAWAGQISQAVNQDTCLTCNRLGNDGAIIWLQQDNTIEGSISVSGTTVSYNGAHLSRWSQLSGIDPYDKTVRPEILRGTVMSNLDEMCDWTCPTSGDCQDNEQLNKTKISDVEGDKNVAGVFQSWDDDDDTWVNDFYLAMTGDFVIRIAAGTTVQRGDLLMSAGDGTAKPQVDDAVRSCTVAKVTSTTVSCTHPDGSYCVPCVLMAC